MAEAIVGDLTPSCGVSKEEKHARELAAMKHIRQLVDESVGNEIYSLWQEYEEQSSPEACYVKDLDRFDMILQAHEYEQAENSPGKLQEFFTSTEGKIHHPDIQKLTQHLKDKRNQLMNGEKPEGS